MLKHKTYNLLDNLLLISLLLFISGCGNSQKSENSITAAIYKDALDFPGLMAEDSINTISRRDNQIILALAGGASIIMNKGADKEIAEHQNKDIFHNIADRSLNFIGAPEFQAAAAGVWYLWSIDTNNEVNQKNSLIMLRALTLTDLTTIGLKAARNNKTPAGDKWGWPSGHTSTCFAAASVLDELYGPKVGIAGYTVASLVAARQLDQRDHWASDIVFGAALGWTIGHTVAGNKELPEVAGFKIIPAAIGQRAAPGILLWKVF